LVCWRAAAWVAAAAGMAKSLLLPSAASQRSERQLALLPDVDVAA
jgi:hypothetical protein